MTELLTTVVVGGGHAGLAVSWHLAARGIDHVVLEAGEVGESWRSSRWDSFTINTPNWSLQLPGDGPPPEPADGFLSRDAWVATLEAYPGRHDLPVRTGSRVTGLGATRDGPGFTLRIDGTDDSLETRSVVIAAGFQRVGRIPAMADALPPTVLSIHAGDYRRPDALPPGAVLIVGSAQSGAQIAEDLLAAGRDVLLSASAVPRCPRRYRGRDVIEWLVVSGMMDLTPDRLPDPRLRFARQPMISGVGRYGHSVSLQWLAGAGVRLLGRLVAIDGDQLRLAPDLAESIRFGDRASKEFRQSIDRTIEMQGLRSPGAEPDPADEPAADPDAFKAPGTLGLAAAGIGSVIWATGFGHDLSWVDLPITGPDGMPANDAGRSPTPGIWFAGIPWMRTRKSGVILGAADDAVAVVDDLGAWLDRGGPVGPRVR